MKKPIYTDNYYNDRNKQTILKLRNVMKELPDFCSNFFRAIENTTSPLTRLNYAYDLRIFFNYIINDIDVFTNYSQVTLPSFSVKELEKLTATHIEMYLQYLSLYTKAKTPYSIEEYENHERGKARKLSSLRSLLSFCYKRQLITKNISELVDIPKTHEKPIIRLEPNEVADLLALVESGRLLTETQKRYHKFTAKRDLALLTLFLGTGIRISECVGLNIDNFDFNTDAFTVTRKGGNKTILYFGPEVHRCILDYLEIRETIIPLEGHENALFLSLQRRRLSNRAIQNLVKKYAQYVTPLKNISPHKLRSTYGTTLYRETGDIYLVADVLGHRDVNTTRKHYAAQSDENRRKAARAVTLREDITDLKPENEKTNKRS